MVWNPLLQSLHRLCPMTVFSSLDIPSVVMAGDSPTFLSCPSANHARNLPYCWLQCVPFSASTSAAALSEILEVDCGLLTLVTCLLLFSLLTYSSLFFHGWQIKQQPQTLMIKIHRWMPELFQKIWQRPIFVFWHFVSNSTVFCSWCVPYSGEECWVATDFSLFPPSPFSWKCLSLLKGRR